MYILNVCRAFSRVIVALLYVFRALPCVSRALSRVNGAFFFFQRVSVASACMYMSFECV